MDLYTPSPLTLSINNEFKGRFSVTNANPPIVYAKVEGPDFLTVTENGEYGGTAPSSEVDSTFRATVSATDNLGTTIRDSFTIVVRPEGFNYALNLPEAEVGSLLDWRPQLIDVHPPVTFRSIRHPVGLTHFPNGRYTGSISVAGDYDIIQTGVDSRNFPVTKRGVLTVREPNALLANIRGEPSIVATVGDSLVLPVATIQGASPFTVELEDASVDWLSVRSSDNFLVGTVPENGDGPINLKVTDSLGAIANTYAWIRVVPRGALLCNVPDIEGGIGALEIPPGIFVRGVAGHKPYTNFLKITGPDTVLVNVNTGEITGSLPATSVSDILLCSVTDSAGTVAQGQGLITVRNTPFAISYGDDVKILGAPEGSFRVERFGGLDPVEYNIIAPPEAPAKASINSTTGLVTFADTPSTYDSATIIRAQDSAGNVSSATLRVARSPAAFSCVAPSGISRLGEFFNQAVTVQNALGSWTAEKVSGDFRILVSSAGAVTAQGLPSGSYDYSVRVRRSFDNTTSTCTGTITVPTAVSAVSCTVANQAGTPESEATVAVAITGGTAPYTITVESSDEDFEPTFSGTTITYEYPANGESYIITITVTDGSEPAQNTTCSFVVTGATAPPALTCTAAGISGTTLAAVSGSASASGGTSPYTYSLSNAPTWLGINSSTGAYSGTLPNTTGSDQFTVNVTDDAGQTTSCTANWSVTERPLILTCLAQAISGVISTSVVGSASATGGAGSYTYSLVNSPSWLSINSSTGAYSGTLPSSRSNGSFNVRVSDANGDTATCTNTWAARNRPIALFCNAQNVSGFTSTTVSGSASAGGGTTPYSYSISGNPSWLSINATTGAYSGTLPSSAGSGSFTVTVTDAAGTSSNCSATWTVVRPVANMTMSCSNVRVNRSTSFTATISIGGGTPPFNITTSTSGGSVSSTTNNRRFTFNGSGRTSSGTYTVSGTDSSTPQMSSSCSGSVTVVNPVSCSDFGTSIYTGQTASGRMRASGGSGSYTFSKASGSSLISVSSGGTVSFTGSSSTGTFSATIRVRDSTDSSNTAFCSAVFRVTGSRPSISVTGPSSVLQGRTASGRVTASGGSGGWTYSTSTSGASVNSSTGVWTYAVSSSATGSVTVNFTATSSTRETLSGSHTFSIDTTTPVSCTGATFNLNTGQTISSSSPISASGGSGSYTFSAGTGSSLISISSSGRVSFSGSSSAGTFTRTVIVRDASNSANSGSCTVTC